MENGQPILVIGSIIDINERKVAEQELLRKNIELAKTNKELDRFVYSASHDMRAPLSSLLGLIDVAQKSDNPDDLPLCFSMMKKRIETMEGFIKEVTDYSRNSRLKIINTDIPLHDFLNQAFENLEYSFPKDSMKFENKIAKGLTIFSDPNRIKVVVNNLLTNAIKYADPQKSDHIITCDAEITMNKICIKISDNGIGIEQDHIEKIFDMFYRASDRSEGSGLGLYIVSETLQRIKGTISCTSSFGEGTEFKIYLPF
jgi:signal transduction histidine kinase